MLLSMIYCRTTSTVAQTIGDIRVHIFMLAFFLWYAHDLRMSALTWKPCTCTNTGAMSWKGTQQAYRV